MAEFYRSIGHVPPVHDRVRAEAALAELDGLIRANDDLGGLGGLLENSSPVCSLLESVFSSSPYLSSLIMRDPEGLQDWLLSEPEAHLAKLTSQLEADMAAVSAIDGAMALLRRYKARVALWLALADIASLWEVEKITLALSEAAETALRTAIRFLFSQAALKGYFTPDDQEMPEKSSGYFVLGLGKLGAYELNYSSDIDLIIFFDPECAVFLKDTEPSTFFVRLTRDLVRMMQERTADGYVFRTDLRLRPDPGATQVALSVDAGLSYYESLGQNWERAALIKARVVAGDDAVGADFLKQLSPFIWRRYLDYAAIADIHAMKRRIHSFRGHGEIAIAGHDVKLGRGGIREIEFFVQTQQLIAGGRQADLRGRGTLAMLQQLQKRKWIDPGTAEDLSGSYKFLRHVEHRLQMIADEQTHKLPLDMSDLERVAHFCGFENTSSFADVLVTNLTRVQGYYDGLFDHLPQSGTGAEEGIFRGDDDNPETLATLKEMGFGDPEKVISSIAAWRSGRYASTRSERARERLNEILKPLLVALAGSAEPDAAIAAFDRFLAGLPTGVQLFSLLCANPDLLRLVADIMGAAPRLARLLGRKPRVLDAVLDPGFFGDLPPPQALATLVRKEVGAVTDYQDCLDRARAVGTEQAFLIGVRVISGSISAEQAGGAYALLAEKLIGALHKAVTREMESTHGSMPGGQAAIIAMGKLGGREMTAASDLDLIIVYDFEGATSLSDGVKPLAGGQYYARFTQRLISALTVPTAEGALYEVDMRLRPSGNAGPAATQLAGFADYQQNKAWTWEHLALTRARVVAGPAPLREEIEEVIRDVLRQKREADKIADDVHEMRARIGKEKGTDDIWNIKLVRGGLVDLEFIAQFLQVIHAHKHPEILDQNISASLARLADAGLLSKDEAEILIPAARLYHDLTQLLRLCLDRPFKAETASSGLKALLARSSGKTDFEALERHLAQTQQQVHAAFDRLVV